MKFINIILEKLNKIPLIVVILFYVFIVISIIIGYAYYSVILMAEKPNHDHITTSSNYKEYYYTCPMHPTVKSDKPGNCPICNMKLVKKIIAKPLAEHLEHSTNTKKEVIDNKTMSVSLSDSELVMANVKTALPIVKSMSKQVEAFGIITYDTNNLSKLPAWIGGRLDKLYVKSIGDVIHKNQMIAKIYSPELISTQKEYLYALQNLKQMNSSQLPELISTYKDTIRAAQQRLKYFGMTEDQILSIKSLDDIKDNIPIYSKYSGTVIEVNVFEGNYVKEGEVLFTLADFSTLWVEAQLNEMEISSIKLNQPVEIYIDSYPDRVLNGRVNYIYPFMENETRSLKVRISLSNYNLKLKPDMYVRVIIKTKPDRQLTIPKSAVFYTGKKVYVWVEKEQGLFEMRHILLGKTYDDAFEVLSGLSPQDKVAISGGFLIDSEAQLSSGMSGGHQH